MSPWSQPVRQHRRNRRGRSLRAGVFFAGLLLTLALLPALVAATSAPQVNATARSGGTYRRPLRDNPTSLDPARTADIYAYTVIQQLFDGLVQFDSHLTPVPAIAGFWEASADGLVWTFSLRQGVKFHNGREVTAEDFVYSFTRLLDPGVQSPVANFFKHIRGAAAFQQGTVTQVEGLQALDRSTLRIVLQEPYAPFLSILAMANAKVVPREEVEQRGEQFGRQPVGSGPFRLRGWEQNQQIVVQAFEPYYEGRPFLDQIIFTIGKKDVDTLQAFLQGEVEESVVPISKAAEVRTDERYRSYTHVQKPALHLLYIGFNMHKTPFMNPKVRQAFNYAIDEEAIVRDIRGPGSIVAHNILPPGMPGYIPARLGYAYNPQRAKELLAEEGYPGGKGLPVMDLWYSSKEETTPRELAAYGAYLAEIGVTLEIHEAESWQVLDALLKEGKASMFRLGWHSDIPDPDHFFFPLLFSTSKTNRGAYENPQLDRLITAARQETKYLRRIALYREIEQIAIADAPWINQHHRVFEYLYQPYVQGVESSSLGAQYIPMKKVWLRKPASQTTMHGR